MGVFNFLSQKVAIDAAPFVRKIIDITTPNRPVGDDQRTDRRYNRVLPVVCCPSKNDKPDIQNSVMGVSQDLSDYGMAIISLEDLPQGEYYISIWPNSDLFPAPVHFRCHQIGCRNIAHGFWSSGYAILEIMNNEQRKVVAQLDQVAQRVLRSSEPQELVAESTGE